MKSTTLIAKPGLDDNAPLLQDWGAMLVMPCESGKSTRLLLIAHSASSSFEAAATRSILSLLIVITSPFFLIPARPGGKLLPQGVWCCPGFSLASLH